MADLPSPRELKEMRTGSGPARVLTLLASSSDHCIQRLNKGGIIDV